MLGVAGIISSLPPPAGSFFPTSLRVTGTSLRVMAHQGQISRSARFRDAHLALSLSLALSSPFALARALAGAEARDDISLSHLDTDGLSVGPMALMGAAPSANS